MIGRYIESRAVAATTMHQKSMEFAMFRNAHFIRETCWVQTVNIDQRQSTMATKMNQKQLFRIPPRLPLWTILRDPSTVLPALCWVQIVNHPGHLWQSPFQSRRGLGTLRVGWTGHSLYCHLDLTGLKFIYVSCWSALLMAP
jgi:hypothetical protein